MKTSAMLLTLTALVTALDAAPAFGASTWDGVYTEAQASQGRSLYQRSCVMCHGQALEGNGEAPPLVGRFIPDWQGTTLADLHEKIHDTMPLFAPATLKAEETSDLLAFILQANGFPAGKSPLVAGEGLKSVNFDVAKPAPQIMNVPRAKRLH